MGKDIDALKKEIKELDKEVEVQKKLLLTFKSKIDGVEEDVKLIETNTFYQSLPALHKSVGELKAALVGLLKSATDFKEDIAILELTGKNTTGELAALQRRVTALEGEAAAG